ncbi:hypothetical protein KCV06_g370, partial [Aureobasidium melanogenum]
LTRHCRTSMKGRYVGAWPTQPVDPNLSSNAISLHLPKEMMPPSRLALLALLDSVEISANHVANYKKARAPTTLVSGTRPYNLTPSHTVWITVQQ